MSVIWDHLVDCQNKIIEIFEEHGTEIQEEGLGQFNRPESGWINRVWANDHIRRAHIDVVDARETKKLWMMHVCVFPVLNNDAPIYGFDVVAGANKITGAFHDLSASVDLDHEMVNGYRESVRDFIPSKKRELPEWATNIFTDSMLAAGNVKEEEEAIAVIDIALKNLRYYMEEVGKYSGNGDREMVLAAQNYYCHNQQQNPHTPRVMKSLGLPEEDVDIFCKDMLFPKVA